MGSNFIIFVKKETVDCRKCDISATDICQNKYKIYVKASLHKYACTH